MKTAIVNFKIQEKRFSWFFKFNYDPPAKITPLAYPPEISGLMNLFYRFNFWNVTRKK